MIDVECEARSILERADYGRMDSPGSLALARRLGLSVREFDAHLLRGCDGETITIHGQRIIAIRRKLTPTRRQWVVAHEIGEAHLLRLDYRQDDVELCADALAGALLMPWASFREAARAGGSDLEQLAEDHMCDQTATAMRLAETAVVEAVVVVTPAKVYARALAEFVLPDEKELRRASRTGHPGMTRVQITDSRKRVALIAA